MCGRYGVTESPQMLALYFMLSAEPAAFSNGDVRPTNLAPIIREQDGLRVATLARWGLIPAWATDPKIAQHTFNARAESVAEKPSFRAAFKRRRCLVPASAFFEWQTIPGEKRKKKLRFSSVDHHPLSLAGLWESWHPEGTEPVETFTIITTQANAFMLPVHDRMPAIIGAPDWPAWLNPDNANRPLLESMINQPLEEDLLQLEPA